MLLLPSEPGTLLLEGAAADRAVHRPRLLDEQREILKEFELSLASDRKRHNPRERSWLDGVKKFFENIGN